MSRINLEPNEPDLWVTVGWYRPFQTYYAQVFRKPADPEADDEQIVWEGFSGNDRILNIDTIRALVTPYVKEFPLRVALQLVDDRAHQR